jgi:tRNA pseudouridine38-40 synthase
MSFDPNSITINPDLQRIRLHLSYDGTGYFGWQKQTKQDGRTIQEDLERALFKLTKTKIKTIGSSRTDAGTHAKDQAVHFDFDKERVSKFNWLKGLNRHLPEQIKVQKALLAPPDFHAILSSQHKTYIYTLVDGRTPDPLKTRFAHWVGSKLDVDYLNRLSKCLIGEHDFKSFQTKGTPLATTVREVTKIHWSRISEDEVQVEVSGSGFLKQMVRNLVGTLIHRYWVEEQKTEDILKILKALDRRQAHGTVPAKGLCLHEVKYPAELDKNCVQS